MRVITHVHIYGHVRLYRLYLVYDVYIDLIFMPASKTHVKCQGKYGLGGARRRKVNRSKKEKYKKEKQSKTEM